MHIAPKPIQVSAADRFGVVMVVPAANNEGDAKEADIWRERLDIMRDVTIYYRNSPSVLFYEGCNQILSTQHMTDMKKVRTTWDPYGGQPGGAAFQRQERHPGHPGILLHHGRSEHADGQPALGCRVRPRRSSPPRLG